MLGDKQNYYREQQRDENPVLYQRNSALEYTLKQKIKTGLWHSFVFGSWLLASHVMVRFILEFGALMWFVTAIAAYIMKSERESIILRLQQTILGYSWGAILYKVIVMRIANIPPQEWSRAYGYQIPAAFAQNITGWLTMVSIIAMTGVPISYGVYLGQKFYSVRTRRRVKDQRKDTMRTGEQKYH